MITAGKIILLAGLVGWVNFLKACTAPFVVAFILYFLGISSLSQEKKKFWGIYQHALWFCLGFLLMFIYKSMTFLPTTAFVAEQVSLITRLGGILLLIVAAHLIGVTIGRIFEKRWLIVTISFFIGAVVALTWQPCSKFVIPLIQSFLSKPEALVLGLITLPFVALGILLPLMILALPIAALLKRLFSNSRGALFMRILSAVIFITMGFLLSSGQIARFYTLAGQIAAPIIINQ